jgi:hypothetical protein
MIPKMKKPGSVGKHYPGLSQKYGHSVTRRDYNKKTAIVRKPLPSPADFYASEISGYVERDNDWAWGCCPFHDDHNPSFCMNLRTGWYECKSSNCGKTGNSIVGFVSALHGLSRAEAIHFLGSWA